MTEDKLIAEIADNEIRYIICKQNSEIEYKVLNKKVSVNTGIHRGKIINFDHTLKKINEVLNIPLNKEGLMHSMLTLDNPKIFSVMIYHQNHILFTINLLKYLLPSANIYLNDLMNQKNAL